MSKIIAIPAFKDNYIWIGVHKESRTAFVVDPGDALPVIDFLNQNDLKLSAILLTHKHADHTGGVSQLLKAYPDAPVYAHRAENISFTTHFVDDNSDVRLAGWDKTFKVIPIPGHTLGHVAYYSDDMLFSGDTLFAAGCGRVFEGTPEQMLSSLDKLAMLPDETLIYCGHEYTLANLKFAAYMEPDNQDIQDRLLSVEKMRSLNQPTLPSNMKLEKKTNPFLRCRESTVISSVENDAGRKLSNTVEVFHALREWKNTF